MIQSKITQEEADEVLKILPEYIELNKSFTTLPYLPKYFNNIHTIEIAADPMVEFVFEAIYGNSTSFIVGDRRNSIIKQSENYSIILLQNIVSVDPMFLSLIKIHNIDDFTGLNLSTYIKLLHVNDTIPQKFIDYYVELDDPTHTLFWELIDIVQEQEFDFMTFKPIETYRRAKIYHQYAEKYDFDPSLKTEFKSISNDEIVNKFYKTMYAPDKAMEKVEEYWKSSYDLELVKKSMAMLDEITEDITDDKIFEHLKKNPNLYIEIIKILPTMTMSERFRWISEIKKGKTYAFFLSYLCLSEDEALISEFEKEITLVSTYMTKEYINVLRKSGRYDDDLITFRLMKYHPKLANVNKADVDRLVRKFISN